MSTKAFKLKKVGQNYRGFELSRIVKITELQCILKELVHQKTGAQVLHLSNEDPENLFCLAFRTTPNTSNGVAHILEHTVLCGSKKYPIKDPFFSMTRRSLHTFMNALTGSDFTCYPAATQVPKDFYNLLDVYLDAVFYPQLKKYSFLQEGWRLEFNPNMALEYKGIVYNEMKGSLATPSTRLSEVISETLFPDLTYGINSGGDPKVIPELTHEELKAFHHQYYHPSRCLFFFYGNMPLEPHLDIIAERVLEHTQTELPLPPIPRQARFIKPVYRELTYPIAAEEEEKDKTMLAFGWLTCHVLEQLELLALSILEIVLMSTDASPLKMALLKSGMCTQASAYAEAEISEVPFVITLKGCNPENAGPLEAILKTTLQEIYTNGVSKSLIENAIHQLEFYRSEITGDSYPFGLSLFMRSALFKQHGGDPEYGLMIHTLFKKLRNQLEEKPRYFEELIKKYFIDNTHFVCIVFYPSKEVADEEKAQEQASLQAIQEKLTPEQKDAIIEQTKKLSAFQKQQEKANLDVLPKIGLEDIPKSARNYPLIREKQGNIEIFTHHCFTNEIVYADLIFPLPFISENDLYLVSLFSSILPQMGCGGRNYMENLEYTQGNTGGIGASLSWNYQAHDHSEFHPTFHIDGKALHRKVDQLFPLLYDIATSVDFTDVKRLKEVLLKHYTNLETSFNRHAMRYAINQSANSLSQAGKIANEWYGLAYYWKIRELVRNFDQQSETFIHKMQDFKKRLLSAEGTHLVLTCSEAMHNQIKQQNFYGLTTLAQHPSSPWQASYKVPPSESQGRVISSPVAFTAHVFSTISYNHPDAAALNLASSLFDNVVLHTRVREQGGAYGGGAVSSALSGTFYFYSYRDPRISDTIDAFEDSVKQIAEAKFDEQELEEAKLEIIQTMDAPIAPGSRGDFAYDWWREGRTLAIRQAFRDKLLALNCSDVQKAVQQHILPNMHQGAIISFASRSLLDQENLLLTQKGNKPFIIKEV